VEALEFWNAALEGAGDDAPLALQVRQNRPHTLAALGRYEEAVEDCRWCLHDGKKRRDRVTQQVAHGSLGDIFLLAGDTGAAELYEQAITLADGRNSVAYVVCCSLALRAWVAAGRYRRVQRAATRLGNAASSSGRPDIAADALTDAAVHLVESRKSDLGFGL